MPRKIKVGKKVFDLIADRAFLETKARETVASLIPEKLRSKAFFVVIKEGKNEDRAFLSLIEANDISSAIQIVERETRKCYWIMTDDEGDEPVYTGFRYFSDLEDFYIVQKVSPQRILD